MRISQISDRPIRTLRYTNAGKGNVAVADRLDVLGACVDTLPEGLEALIATSDLQGVAPSRRARGKSVLLGVALVVCGHVHWDSPLYSPSAGPQVLNVDNRVVVMTRAQSRA